MKADSAQFKKVDRGQLWPVSRASWPEQTDEGGGHVESPKLTAVNFSIRMWQPEVTG
jgi:hypothetical protein